MNNHQPTRLTIILVSGSCCYPGMVALDNKAQQIILQALNELGLKAEIRILPISSALQGGIPAEILQQLQAHLQPANLMRLPAVLINGSLFGFGVPDLELLKAALQMARAQKI